MTKLPPLLLTGASGTLGTVLAPRLAGHFTVHAIGHGRLPPWPGGCVVDLTSAAAVQALVERVRPQVVVHAAALADVDACERDPDAARRLNVDMPRHLAEAVGRTVPDCLFVHISTDQVYDGQGLHHEDRPAPCNVYARTKLDGEDGVRHLRRHLVLRTNFFLSGGGRGFADWLIRSMEEGAAITLFEDVLFNPLYAGDLADIVVELIASGATGTFNVGADGPGMSKADFARQLAERLGLSLVNARVGRLAQVALAARRPLDMRMDVRRLSAVLGHPPPTVEDGLDRLVRERRAAV